MDLTFILIAFIIAIIPFAYIFYMMFKNKGNLKTRLIDLLPTILVLVLSCPLFVLSINSVLPFLWPTYKLGLFLFDVALIFHAYSLKTLGSNFSDSNIPKENAKLIVTGPYAYIRHPIYSAWFFEGLSLMLIAPWLLLIGLFFIIMIPFYRLVVLKEEEELIKFFGEDYKLYMQRVRYKIIPYIY